MTPKCCAPSKSSGSDSKHQRKMLTIAEKVKLFDMLEEYKCYQFIMIIKANQWILIHQIAKESCIIIVSTPLPIILFCLSHLIKVMQRLAFSQAGIRIQGFDKRPGTFQGLHNATIFILQGNELSYSNPVLPSCTQNLTVASMAIL